tara:strand:+ start:300 stop:2366 length:2067 start_codon:yes stop_codon:yes gene_type:complete
MNLELYIDNIRVDLFKDEAITLTDSQQNIKNISVVFAPFSQQFNLPASSTNSKLFKHYYNNDIINGYDARFRVNAIIKLDGTDYKVGKIRLDSVSMKDNKAFAYKVVFFGNTVSLKDIFGNETLSSLNPLNTYDLSFQGTDIFQGLKVGLQSTGVDATNTANRNITFPLITLQNYYSYDSSNSISTPNLHNANFNNLKTEIKPALKCKRIIEAIQTQYNIAFNMADETGITSFFGSPVFDELYLWLHREKTPVTEPQTVPPTFGVNLIQQSAKITFANLTFASGTNFISSGKLPVSDIYIYTIRFTCNTGAGKDLEIIVKDKPTNELLENRTLITPANNFQILLQGLTSGTLSSRDYDLEFRFNADSGGLTANAVRITRTLKDGSGATIGDYTYAATNFAQNIFMQDYLPNMKVLDFLTTLFKTFNLTAYTKRGSDKIYVETFDDFMSTGVTTDISEYIDVTQNNIDRPIPYSIINFQYAPPVTQTSLRFLNQFSQNFGGLSYSAPDKFDGQAFQLQLQGQRSQLINPRDENGALTGNVFAWWVDAEAKTTLGQPYLFFNRLVDSSSYPILLNAFNSYNAPSNVSSDGNHSLNFGAEFDEYTGEVNTNSLFNRFYSQYIVKLFEEQARIVKFTAQLPSSIILNYELNDVFIVNGQEYYINSITTNLLSNKSELELITKQSGYTSSVLT